MLLKWLAATGMLVVTCVLGVAAQRGGAGTRPEAGPAPPDDVKTIVERLDLERYKATIKGLTAFGDRREGTDRNRAATDWIEAQLKSYGCPTERITYDFRPRASDSAHTWSGAGSALADRARRRTLPRDADADERQYRSAQTARRKTAGAQHAAVHAGRAPGSVLHEGRHHPARRDVHRRRAYGRTRVGRSGERQRIGDGAGDGTGACLQ